MVAYVCLLAEERWACYGIVRLYCYLKMFETMAARCKQLQIHQWREKLFDTVGYKTSLIRSIKIGDVDIAQEKMDIGTFPKKTFSKDGWGEWRKCCGEGHGQTLEGCRWKVIIEEGRAEGLGDAKHFKKNTCLKRTGIWIQIGQNSYKTSSRMRWACICLISFLV